MAEAKTTAQRRLGQVKDVLTMNKTATNIPFDPDSTKFPRRRDVPQVPNAPPGQHWVLRISVEADNSPGAAWVWGEKDFVSKTGPLTSVIQLMGFVGGPVKSLDPY